MSESSTGDTERNEADRYEVGNDIARRARHETPRIDVLRDELPELTDKEYRVLDDNIEKAIRDEVVRTLRERSGDSDTEQTEQPLRELHRRFTTLESAVESAVNDLRANSRPGQTEREVANDLEAALDGNGRYEDTDVRSGGGTDE